MTGYTPLTQIKVGLDFTGEVIPVGRFAIRERRIYFEYDTRFVKSGLELSPVRLPLKMGVHSFDPFLFEGLPGLFNDSLADGWGRLLFDRTLRAKGMAPDEISPLDRLAHVGMTGMGEGRSPTEAHLIKLGTEAKIEPKKTAQIIEQTKHALSQWKMLAKNYGVSRENISLIERRLSGNT